MKPGLVDLRIPHGPLQQCDGRLAEVGGERLKAPSRHRRVEVDAVQQGIDLNVDLGGLGEPAFGVVRLNTESQQGLLVVGDVLLVFALELLHAFNM